MVELSSLINASRVQLDVEADCSKAVFRCVSEVLSPMVGIAARDIAGALNERERMGSTAVGEGLSIPHARLDQVNEPQGFLLRLKKPIDMDAPDDQLVDLFFILLVPKEADNDHLRVLSRIARLIRLPENRDRLRESQSVDEVAALFQE